MYASDHTKAFYKVKHAEIMKMSENIKIDSKHLKIIFKKHVLEAAIWIDNMIGKY